MTPLTDPQTGGSPVTSYNLQWNSGISNTFFNLIGEDGQENVSQFKFTKPGLSTGASYIFRYRSKNIYEWSLFSDEFSIISAVIPSKITPAVETINKGTSMKIEWTEPYNGGDPLTKYMIEIKGTNGSWNTEMTYCNGADPVIITSKFCAIPISVLIIAPFELIQGNLIEVRVRGVNRIGDGLNSDVNLVGALI
jgi:hypothetical protein